MKTKAKTENKQQLYKNKMNGSKTKTRKWEINRIYIKHIQN